MRNSFFYLSRDLYHYLDISEKNLILKLIFITVLSSVFEMFVIASVVPIISLLSSGELASIYYVKIRTYTSLLPLDKSHEVNFFVSLFLVLISISCFLRIAMLRETNRFVFRVGASISKRIFDKFISLSYEEFIKTNSSELIDMLTKKIDHVVHGFLMPVVNIVSSIFLIIGIMLILIIINPTITLITFSFFIISYLLITLSVRNILRNNSLLISTKSLESIEILQCAYGYIRDIILGDKRDFFKRQYHCAQNQLSKSLATNLNVANSPRYVIEAVSIAGVVAIAAYLKNSSNIDPVVLLPIIGAVVLGAQRMLPCIQQIYGGFANMKASQESLQILLNFYSDTSVIGNINKKIKCKFENLDLINVSYSYDNDNKFAVKNCSLSIIAGQRYAIRGSSGSGKSTFVDLLSGLLFPTSGVIKLNGNDLNVSTIASLRNLISYVPQTIFIANESLVRNIAFGVKDEDIDYKRVNQAILGAKLQNIALRLPQGIESKLGENGRYLSGGEKQRIGIARALYNKSDIIIFDEATSSLDLKTEKEIMETIYGLDRSITLIIIAHRVETLSECDYQIYINDGNVTFQ